VESAFGLTNSPNHFLSSLSAQDRDLLQPHLRPLQVPLGVALYSADDIIPHVYFPYTGIMSIIVGVGPEELELDSPKPGELLFRVLAADVQRVSDGKTISEEATFEMIQTIQEAVDKIVVAAKAKAIN
jgi:hypothetical protein